MSKIKNQYKNPFLKTQALSENQKKLLNKAVQLQQINNLFEAKIICKTILDAEPNNAEANHLLGVIFLQFDDYSGAIELFNKAIISNSKNAIYYSNKGTALQKLMKFDEAISCFDKAIALKSDYMTALYNRGNLRFELKQFESAVKDYEKAIKIDPNFPDVFCNLGNALSQLGLYDSAILKYQIAIKLNPNYYEAYLNKGVAEKALNRVDQSIESYKKSNKINSERYESYFNIGNIYYDQKNYEMAAENFHKATLIKSDFLDAHLNLGLAFKGLKQFDISIICFENVIKINGNYSDAYLNLGVVYSELKREDAAIACYEKAIELDPNSETAYINLGESLKEKRNLPEALTNFNKAFGINPEANGLIGKRHEVAMSICYWRNFQSSLDFALLKIRENKFVCTPFSSLIVLDDPELHLLTARTYVTTQSPQNESLGAIPKREPRARVRIGYYSADLYYHPVSIWLAEQLENHDKSKVELYAFCLKSVQDPMRDRLEAAFDHWIDVQSISDLEITKLSRELEIDIAIDLNGHTADGRPGIFAARAAPIQLNHLGFPGSMGAEYIDYMIFPTPSPDEDLQELAINRQFITEKIAYVPSSFTYDRQRQLSDEPLTRAQFGLPEKGFVFTCQNGCQKVMPEVFDIWMEILKAVPGSVLWLLKPNETAVTNLINEAKARGVEAERLIFTAREVVSIDQERARIGKYLASYKLADLFLDTWPYNAGTTAIDALWAGLPVLTKTGEAIVARMAAEALRALEVPELITRTPQAYQELAIELAHSPDKLKQLKEKVQRNRLASALFDPVANTRHIENAYLEMYRRYQESIAPEDFYTEE